MIDKQGSKVTWVKAEARDAVSKVEKKTHMLLKVQRRRNKSKEQYDIREESGLREKKQKKMRGEMLVCEYVEILVRYRWGWCV